MVGAYAVLGELAKAHEHLVAADMACAATVPDVRHWNNLLYGQFLLCSIKDGPWDEYIDGSSQMWRAYIETATWLSNKEQRSVPREAGPVHNSVAAHVHARRGRISQAVEALSRLVPYLWEASMSEYRHCSTHHNAAEVIWFTGDTTHLNTVEATIRQRWLPLALSNIGADARLSLARLCAIDGRVDEATNLFAFAREVFAAQGALPFLAITDRDEAWMHIRNPGKADTDSIAVLLESAAAACRTMDMTGWSARVAVLQQEFGLGVGFGETGGYGGAEDSLHEGR